MFGKTIIKTMSDFENDRNRVPCSPLKKKKGQLHQVNRFLAEKTVHKQSFSQTQVSTHYWNKIVEQKKSVHKRGKYDFH